MSASVSTRLRLMFTPRRIAWAFVVIIAILTVLSVAEQYVIHIMGRDDLEEFLIAVDLDAESNIPTWYQSFTLLVAAVLLAVISRTTKLESGRYAGHWRALSWIFVFLSIDEIAQLHEHLGRLQSVWHTHGIFFFAWVIPGSIVAVLVALLFARFLAHLPARTRLRILIAGIVYVGGALGVEAISGCRAETKGMNNMTHSLIATVEEDMEMIGVALFIVTLLRHLAAQRAVVEISAEERPAD